MTNEMFNKEHAEQILKDAMDHPDMVSHEDINWAISIIEKHD